MRRNTRKEDPPSKVSINKQVVPVYKMGPIGWGRGNIILTGGSLKVNRICSFLSRYSRISRAIPFGLWTPKSEAYTPKMEL